MKAFWTWALLLSCLPFAAAAEPTIFENPGEPTPANRIDELTFAQLKAATITPARLCSDAVFLRRVYLDVIGKLPTAAEAKAFLADTSPKKRAKLIDALLEREEFADLQAMRWCDLLRVKSEFPINLWPNAVQAYHRWIRTAVKENMPYDQFARAMLTSSGSNFRVPQVNFFRAVQSKTPPALAKAAALSFMGDRMADWPKARKTGLETFFTRVGYKSTAEWKEEIVYFNTAAPAADSAMLPDGTTVKLPPDKDPREVFADWLISPKNPWFAKCAVNRVWCWLLGRGIIHEPDDIRPDNPPVNPKLLACLEEELVKSKYDLKHIYRLILNSSTYQLSSISRTKDPKAAAMFARYPIRRLDAEVLADAVCQVTGTTEEYSSAIPEPFTWIPTDMPSVCLPDGSINSSFLELLGRPPRDTGMLAERSNGLNATQRLHMLNSSHIRDKIERGPVFRQWQRTIWKDPKGKTEEIYLSILSRYPTTEELEILKTFTAANRKEKGANPLADIVWALINSPEFLYRH